MVSLDTLYTMLNLTQETYRPGLREILITDPSWLTNCNPCQIIAQHISPNWPHSVESCLTQLAIEPDQQVPMITISPNFDAHIRDLGNWTVSPEYVRTFPNFVAHLDIK